MATKTQIKSNGWHDVTVDDNLITGDTYKCSDFIKKQLGGKWDAQAKGWRVDPQLLQKYTHPTSGVIGRW
jgi:hypothetical protein